jgi:hypothetical protein
MNKNLLAFVFLLTTGSLVSVGLGMINQGDYAYQKLDQVDDDVNSHYIPESDTLDFSASPMGDDWLDERLEDIKAFIEKNHVKCLLLESMGLKKGPYENGPCEKLIQYAMNDENLRIVSFQNNNFFDNAAMGCAATGYFVGHLFGVKNLARLWDTLPEEVASTLMKQNSAYKKLSHKVLKKIILIDKIMPPIVIFHKSHFCQSNSTTDPVLQDYFARYIAKYMEGLSVLVSIES